MQMIIWDNLKNYGQYTKCEMYIVINVQHEIDKNHSIQSMKKLVKKFVL